MADYFKILKRFERMFNFSKKSKLEEKIVEDINRKANSKKSFFFIDEFGQKYCLKLIPVINYFDNKIGLEESLVLEKILNNNLREEIGVLCLLKNGSKSYSIKDYETEKILEVLGNECSFYCLSYNANETNNKGNKEIDIVGPFSIKEIYNDFNNFSQKFKDYKEKE
ncbi:MAG: hypothetical protein ACP5H9_04065 [Candidatus Woesearchaeota archaeon]